MPGIPIPPSIPPIVDCTASSTFLPAPLMAAVMRSSSISMSPDLIASGSILMLNTCLRPSIFTVTLPPPAELSTTVSCIFFCSTSYCRLACDINSCRLNPLIRTSSKTGLNSFPFVIDYGTDFRAKFFHHPFHHWFLLGASAAASIRRGRRFPGVRRGRRTGKYLQPYGSAQNAAGRGNDQALAFVAGVHIDQGCGRRHLDGELISGDTPLARIQHGRQHGKVGFAEGVQNCRTHNIRIRRHGRDRGFANGFRRDGRG